MMSVDNFSIVQEKLDVKENTLSSMTSIDTLSQNHFPLSISSRSGANTVDLHFSLALIDTIA